ncbi:putative ribonuclease H-like domain-containing protein [Tanacetum coccineum]
MYSFDLKNVVPTGDLTCLFAKVIIDKSKLWHRRLGHVNFKTMNKLLKENLVRGLPSKTFENDHTCVACQKGKQYKASWSGPDWLFDIDLLTNSMNYEPVTAWNQTNKNAGIKDNVDATNKEPANKGERNGQKDDGGASNKEDDQNVQDFRAALDNLFVQQKEGYANSTNRDSTVSPSISTAGGAYDDEDVGTEADLNNLETTINVSLIPTTRIHQDHLKDQIVGDINSATQTRRMTKISKEHKVWRLVDLPKGKHAIGKKWVYRNKKDKRGIVVRNKARLVTQGYTQEEGIDYDDVFSLVARIEAIRGGVSCLPTSGFDDPLFLVNVYKVEKALLTVIHQRLLEPGIRLVYVDDIIFGSTKKSLCIEFESLMHKKFQISSIGELTFFLGLQVMQKDDGIFISQDKYVADILKKFDFVTESEVYVNEEEDENNNSNGNVDKRGITRLSKFRIKYGKPDGIKLNIPSMSKEKGGYARGVGSGVIYKRYFDLPGSRQASDERIALLQSQLDNERRERQDKKLGNPNLANKMSDQRIWFPK